MAIGAFMVAAGAWYLTHLDEVAGYIGASGDTANPMLTNQKLLAGPWYGPERLSWYPAVAADAWGTPAAVALVAAVSFGWVGRRRPGAWSAPMLAVACGGLSLTLQIQRQDRYLTPAVPLLASMVAGPAGWVALPVLATGAYGAARMYGRKREVPIKRDYSHGWPPDGGDFPWMHEAFEPASLDPTPWELDRAVAAMAGVHGREDGTVALLIDDQGQVPGFGVFLSAVTRAGHRWDVATVRVMDRGMEPGAPPPGAVYVGPFTTDDWPPRTFRTLFAVLRPEDRKRLGWVERQGFELAERWSLPQGMDGRLYVLPVDAPDAGPDPMPEVGEGLGGPGR